MIPFQFAGIGVCAAIAIWGLRRFRRRHRPGWLSLLAVVVGGAGAVTIYDPELTTRLARLLGIARGADLLLYLVSLAFLASWFYFYGRLRSLSIAVTALVRELALREPLVPGNADAPETKTPEAAGGRPPASS
jgi:hypothetical protein